MAHTIQRQDVLTVLLAEKEKVSFPGRKNASLGKAQATAGDERRSGGGSRGLTETPSAEAYDLEHHTKNSTRHSRSVRRKSRLPNMASECRAAAARRFRGFRFAEPRSCRQLDFFPLDRILGLQYLLIASTRFCVFILLFSPLYKYVFTFRRLSGASDVCLSPADIRNNPASSVLPFVCVIVLCCSGVKHKRTWRDCWWIEVSPFLRVYSSWTVSCSLTGSTTFVEAVFYLEVTPVSWHKHLSGRPIRLKRSVKQSTHQAIKLKTSRERKKINQINNGQ